MMAGAGEGFENDFLKNMLVWEGLLWEGLHAEIKVGLGNCTFELILKRCKTNDDADGL